MKYRDYVATNEARNSKKAKRAAERAVRFNQRTKSQQQQQQQRNRNFNTNYVNPQAPGMPLMISDRLKYIFSKMSESGNRAAKELLSLTDQKDKKFEMSYLDITKKDDSLSYLPPGGKDLPDAEKYDNNKRQYSKVYKVVKTICGSRYTKTEVQKFVSMYKSIYNKGPEKEDLPKPTDEQILNKIIRDTKSDKLKWKEELKTSPWVRYEAKVSATDTKGVMFHLYIFYSLKDTPNCFLTVHFFNEKEKYDKDKKIHIKTYKYDEGLIDFIKDFVEKYKVPVE